MPSNFLTSHCSGPVSMEAGADVAVCVSIHCAKPLFLEMTTPQTEHLVIKADGVAGLNVLVPRHMVSQEGLSEMYHQSVLF